MKYDNVHSWDSWWFSNFCSFVFVFVFIFLENELEIKIWILENQNKNRKKTLMPAAAWKIWKKNRNENKTTTTYDNKKKCKWPKLLLFPVIKFNKNFLCFFFHHFFFNIEWWLWWWSKPIEYSSCKNHLISFRIPFVDLFVM